MLTAAEVAAKLGISPRFRASGSEALRQKVPHTRQPHLVSPSRPTLAATPQAKKPLAYL